jgi:mannose-6-phosphate isomerase-like protein (cupin superfamily)
MISPFLIVRSIQTPERKFMNHHEQIQREFQKYAKQTIKGFVTNIEKDTVKNNNFRKVIYTAKHSQLVLMSLKPNEDIGSEVHKTIDQFFRIESGTGKVVINGISHKISDGSAFIVPAGSEHNVINDGTDDLKLYSIYSPPNHIDGTIHKTKADVVEEHFNGKTSE